MGKYRTTEPCEGCKKPYPVQHLTEVVVLESRQTHWEPAEYRNALVCDACLAEDECDPEYERANLRFKEETGSEL